MCRNSNFLFVMPMKKSSPKVGYFSKTAEIFSTAMTAQSDQKPSTFCFKVIFNFIDFSIAKVGRPSQSCAENYFQMILLLLVLLGHKVVSSLGALLGQPPAAHCPLPSARRYSSRVAWAGRPAACRPPPSHTEEPKTYPRSSDDSWQSLVTLLDNKVLLCWWWRRRHGRQFW